MNLSDDFEWQIEDYEWTLFCADIKTKYSFSLYFAITTMASVGYGDITPMTNIERNFAMLFEVVGSLIAALFFANMAVLIAGIDTRGDRLREKMGEVKHYIKTRCIPAELAQRMKDAVEYWWQVHSGLNVKDYLADIPVTLRIEIFSHSEGLRGPVPDLRRPEPGLFAEHHPTPSSNLVFAEGHDILPRGG